MKNPTNTLEIGASNTSQSSAKFGEYNGLNKSGGKAIANFSVRGGDAYGGSNGTKRWSITGSDLGTTSRALGATVGNQGRWNLYIGYDELRHNITDTYPNTAARKHGRERVHHADKLRHYKRGCWAA